MRYAAMILAGFTATAGLAEDVPVETGKIGKSAVTLHVQPFLNDQELATLRLVLTNKQALEIFLGQGEGFAAMAVHPEEGFIRDGQPVKSALALSGMASREEAAEGGDQGLRGGGRGQAACVLVLEVEYR